jgi:hypothetical protein
MNKKFQKHRDYGKEQNISLGNEELKSDKML